MKRMVLISVVSVLGAGLFAGCSNEVHNPHEREMCPTDGLAILGQEIYYGKFTSCIEDGHQVPVPGLDDHYHEMSASVDVSIRH